MKLTPFQSGLLTHVCSQQIKDSNKITHYANEFLHRLLLGKPVQTFESLMSKLERLSSLLEIESFEDYYDAIYLLQNYGEMYQFVSEFSTFLTGHSVKDLSLMEETSENPKGTFQDLVKADRFLELARRMEIAQSAEGVSSGYI